MSTIRIVEDTQQALQNLMKQNDHLRMLLNQAVEDMRKLGRMGQNVCPVCAYYNHGEGCKECVKCMKEDCFRWRCDKDDHASH